MNIQERAESYNRTFPKWPPVSVHDRWLHAVWILGNNYRGSGYYGSYPPNYLRRVMALFPDAKNVLHLFSGSLTPEGLSGFPGQHVRVDINPKCKPDIVCDAVTLSSVFEEETFDLVLADPPYSKEDAERYGVPMINRKKVLEEAAKVTTVGGNIVWLDQVAPIFRKSLLHMWGLIGIFRSTNNRFRMASIFSRVGK